MQNGYHPSIPCSVHRPVRWAETGTWPWRSVCQHVSLSPRLSPSLRHHSSRPSRNFPPLTLSYLLFTHLLPSNCPNSPLPYSTLLYSNRAFQSPDISSHPSHSNSLQASQTTNHHHHLRHSSSGDPLPTFHCFPFASLFVWSIKLTLKQVSSGLGHFSFQSTPLHDPPLALFRISIPGIPTYLLHAGDSIAFVFWS